MSIYWLSIQFLASAISFETLIPMVQTSSMFCVSIEVMWELCNVFVTQESGKCSNRVVKEIGGQFCWTPAAYYIVS